MRTTRACSLEFLEPRSLFAAGSFQVVDVPLLITPMLVSPPNPVSGLSGVTLVNGTLTVTGTHRADKITLTRQSDGVVRVPQTPGSVSVSNTNGQIKFIVNPDSTIGVSAVELNRSDLYVLRVGSASYAVKAAGINKIVIKGGDGDDTIRVAKNVLTQTTVNGGAGNDLLEAGRKTDILNGNAGDDRMVGSFDTTAFRNYRGGDGKDVLTGKFALTSPVPSVNADVEELSIVIKSA